MPSKELDNPILFIGDSISANINIDALESATQRTIIRAKAYSSIHDTVQNVAKQAARFPSSNFTDVIPAQLRKAKFHSLLLQAGSVDITNLQTNESPSRYLEYFKQETIVSAKNLFTAAVNALSSQPSLRKVVIMKQIPRYDPAEVDPLSLKPTLSQLFNNTLSDLWMNSSMKHKIVIGSHNIDCTGAIKESRYREPKTGRFDGIHLLGNSSRKFYTLSVLNIIKAAQLTSSQRDYHQSCAQYQYQTRQQRGEERQNMHRQTESGNKKYTNRLKWKKNNQNVYKQSDSVTSQYSSQYTVPTSNRFQQFSESTHLN